MSDDKKPTIEYACTAQRGGASRVVDVLIAMCFIGALAAAACAFVETQRRPFTKAREQYELARAMAQTTRPSYAPPPYAGKTYEDVSAWWFGSTYIAVALLIAGVTSLVVRNKRPLVAS